MHHEDIESIFKKLNSNQNGLSSKEAQKRLLENGKNILPKKKKDSFIKIFLRGILDPIVLLLVITVVFSLIVGEKTDAIAISFIILVDLILGAVQ